MNLDFSNGSLTLKDFLESSPVCPKPLDDKTLEYIQQYPETVLIVIDGFDEYKHAFPEQHNLCAQLMSGEHLPGATVVITSRPEAVRKLQKAVIHRKAEVLGFEPDDVQYYLRMFFDKESDETKKMANDHFVKNNNILHMCYVPINCFLVCSYLKDTIKYRKKLPRSLAGLYKTVMGHFLKKHHPECKLDKTESAKDNIVIGVFDKLSHVAYHFLQSKCFEFTEEKLTAAIKTSIAGDEEVEKLKESCLFHRMPSRKTSPLVYETYFCFIHVTIQEFLAAHSLVKRCQLVPVSDEWAVVIQFMAGLLAKEGNGRRVMKDIVERIIPCEAIEQQNRNTLIIRCLNEYDGKDFAQEIVNQHCITELSFLGYRWFTAADISALAYVIRNTFIISIQVSGIRLRMHECAEIAFAMCSTICQLQVLNLCSSNICDACAAHFKEALCNPNCHLKELHLDVNNIGAAGAEHFKKALCNPNCHLKVLNFGHNNIGDVGAAHFSKEALCNPNCHLKVLNLEGNNIGDAGAAHFKEALCSANCPLQELVLECNNIGDAGAAHFKEALCSVNCHLQVLNLDFNNIGDAGAAHFKETLCSDNCHLQVLWLGGNNIGADEKVVLQEQANSCDVTLWI